MSEPEKFQFKLDYQLDRPRDGGEKGIWLIADFRAPGQQYVLEKWGGWIMFPRILAWLRRVVLQRLPAECLTGERGSVNAFLEARRLAPDHPDCEFCITPRSALRTLPEAFSLRVPRLQLAGSMLRPMYAYARDLERRGIAEPSGLTSAAILALEPLIKSPAHDQPEAAVQFNIASARLDWCLWDEGVTSWHIDQTADFWPQWFEFMLKLGKRSHFSREKFEHPDREYIDQVNQWVTTGALPPVEGLGEMGDKLEAESWVGDDRLHLTLVHRDLKDEHRVLLDEVFDRRALVASFCDSVERHLAAWDAIPASERSGAFDFRSLPLDELKKLAS